MVWNSQKITTLGPKALGSKALGPNGLRAWAQSRNSAIGFSGRPCPSRTPEAFRCRVRLLKMVSPSGRVRDGLRRFQTAPLGTSPSTVPKASEPKALGAWAHEALGPGPPGPRAQGPKGAHRGPEGRRVQGLRTQGFRGLGLSWPGPMGVAMPWLSRGGEKKELLFWATLKGAKWGWGGVGVRFPGVALCCVCGVW